jgi:hypothetical protein
MNKRQEAEDRLNNYRKNNPKTPNNLGLFVPFQAALSQQRRAELALSQLTADAKGQLEALRGTP